MASFPSTESTVVKYQPRGGDLIEQMAELRARICQVEEGHASRLEGLDAQRMTSPKSTELCRAPPAGLTLFAE